MGERETSARGTAPASRGGLSLVAPVHLLDEGRLLRGDVKWWWTAQLKAQRYEIQRTLGDSSVVRDVEAIAHLAAPSVLVVPAITGGVVGKRDWVRFQDLLWQYVRRGGVVVLLRQALCLNEDGAKAGGRTLEGVSTRAAKNFLPGSVTFQRTGGFDAEIVPSAGLPTSITVATGHGFWVEHEIRNAGVAGADLQELAQVRGGTDKFPLLLRLAYRANDYPGAVLFMNTWSWMRRSLDEETRSRAAKSTDRVQAEACFAVLRALNREIVLETLAFAASRSRQRARRLELLSGEGDRLRHAMGGEKDYHRLLANDVDLLLDLPAPSDSKLLKELCGLFEDSAPWPEPPHEKGSERRGRLDILLVASDQEVERDPKSLRQYLVRDDRRPVAWIELEAHALDLAQMKRFTDGMKGTLHKGDFVFAVDRSRDDDANVLRVKERVEALGARFLHVQVPEAFDHLEERYMPELHRLQRRRYTVDVIRGLLG
jgi:hypothetical protein